MAQVGGQLPEGYERVSPAHIRLWSAAPTTFGARSPVPQSVCMLGERCVGGCLSAGQRVLFCPSLRLLGSPALAPHQACLAPYGGAYER